MPPRPLSIALLAANPALAGILARTLEDDGGHSVATFGGVEALTTYLRTTCADVVLIDTELPGAPIIDIARGLRSTLKLATDDFAIVALTDAAPAFHRPLLSVGIDQVLQKPVTPSRLLAAVGTLRAHEEELAVANGPAVRLCDAAVAATPRVGNVIPLFGEGRRPR